MIKHEGPRAEFSNNAVSVKSCTCVYPNNNRPSNEMLPEYATPAAPAFTITNLDGMALGIRPKINCDSEDELDIETQLSDPNNPRQQFQCTLDGQIVSVRCPKKVLTADCDANANSLQMPELTPAPCSLREGGMLPNQGQVRVSEPCGWSIKFSQSAMNVVQRWSLHPQYYQPLPAFWLAG